MGDLNHTICSLVIDNKWFAISVDYVREAIRPLPISKIPLTPPEILGLTNLRGSILPVVDPRICLGLNPRDPAENSFFLVLESPKTEMALIVDKVSDVHTFTDNQFLQTPVASKSELNYYVNGAYQTESNILMRLEIERFVERLHMETLRTVGMQTDLGANAQTGSWSRPQF